MEGIQLATRFISSESRRLSTTYLSAQDANIAYVLWAAALVFSMQCGFAMLECGSVRKKNTKNILVKNLMDACIGALCWWSFGYAFAYGAPAAAENGNGFIGSRYFFLADEYEKSVGDGLGYADWFFGWTFAAAATSIVSGAVAERACMGAYFGYAAVLTSFVYPVVVHWVWASAGIFSASGSSPLLNVGAVDFAGSGVVHLTGGVAAFVGALFLGARTGRFTEAGAKDLPKHSATMQCLGTFLLWIGWYGFNCGSTLGIAGSGLLAGKVAITTTLSAACGASSALIIGYIQTGAYDLGCVMNGVLGGLVSITAGCASTEPWCACLIGLIGGGVMMTGSYIVKSLRVDDVVDAVAVHGFCGLWGLLAVGFFADEGSMRMSYGSYAMAKQMADIETYKGVFWGGNGKLLACNFTLSLAILAWVGVTMSLFFFCCAAAGVLRVTEAEELEGLDVSHHGGKAYEEDEDDVEKRV